MKLSGNTKSILIGELYLFISKQSLLRATYAVGSAKWKWYHARIVKASKEIDKLDKV